MRTALLAAVFFAVLLNCAYSAPQADAATLQEIENVLMQGGQDKTYAEEFEDGETKLLCRVVGDQMVSTDKGTESQGYFRVHLQRSNVRQQGEAEIVALSCTPVKISSDGEVTLIKHPEWITFHSALYI